ncbi:VanZ family protein [Candidatus Nitrotoga sp. M5]|uniref:VanZ family protein n=1 Tax=Candidatus Nitrotoga sp. M5 TaxID=2890409 RepID=UPI001EF5274E|nr:VanZ family protein [Candidatus Nitrotoga sp. M5]CAH1387177.1 VanZ like family protein [Candidatus Nitrotoga sp. M5]
MLDLHAAPKPLKQNHSVGSPNISSARFPMLALAIAYTLFVIYGSLVPLNFQHQPLNEALEAFRNIRYFDLKIGNRADWVANILLFIPLAFLWSGVLWSERGFVVRVLIVLWVLIACLGLGVAIEFVQLYFPPRTVSLNDIFAESIGAVVGVMAWCVLGRRLSEWLAGWRSARGSPALSGRLLYLYVFVLFTYNLLPLDLTLSPVEIFHKWREGRVVLIPFSFVFENPAEAWYGVLTDILIWMPVAFLWRLSPPTLRLTSFSAVIMIATFLEFLQLFVYSRVSDATDIITAAIGAALGTWLSRRWAGQTQQSMHGGAASRFQAWLWLGLALMWVGLLAAIFWYPFDFHTGRTFITERLQGLNRVPFETYYYGTEFRAVTEVLHKVGFFIPLGMLLALGVAQIQHYSWRQIAGWIALISIGLVAFGIELGQLLLPSKFADVTDWALEVLGGLAGYIGTTVLGERMRETHRIKMKAGQSRVANAGLPTEQDALHIRQSSVTRDNGHA